MNRKRRRMYTPVRASKPVICSDYCALSGIGVTIPVPTHTAAVKLATA